MKKIGVFVGLILLTVVLSLTGILGDLRTAIGQSPPSGSGTKLCSAVVSGNWRDSISAPATWTFMNCIEYSRSVGATSYELGCVFSDRVVWPRKYTFPEPTVPYLVPVPNCGW